MRKFYSLVLLAVGLLIGTNAWADGLIENVRTGVQYDHLKDAFAAAQDGDVLELTGNMNESQSDGAAWFGEATSGTLSNYASTDRSITLDLKGHLYNLTGAANYKIALTRGVLRIKSTGGEGEIKSDKGVIAVYGTYLKIDAKNETPFTHLIIEENVKITSAKSVNGDQYRGIVLNSPLCPYQATSEWGWANQSLYPCDYNCDIFPTSQHGISNGARIDIYGKVEGDKYAFQVSGNIRSSREFLNEDGTYNTSKGHFPLYRIKSGTGTETVLYKPGTTTEGKTKDGSSYYDTTIGSNNDYFLTAADNKYTGYIHVYSTATLKTNNPNSSSSVGLYSAGYARCYIEGTCEGSTGVYVKAGDVELHDATVVSNWESDYKPASNDGSASGVNGGGSAVVIESKVGWTGNIEVTISGDTHVSTNHGYAIDEQVTSGGTNVNYLTITGGTFEGGQVPVVTPNTQDPTKNDTTWVQGTMHVSQPTLDAHHDPDTITTITILGAEVKGETNQIGEGEGQVTLADFLAGQSGTHVTYVEDESGKTTMIVSEGNAPETDPDEVYTTWQYIADNAAANKSFAWTKVPENAEILTGTTVILNELEINSGTELKGNQQLTIHDGATLQVERLIMNGYARIIVEAGGKLIVTGTQGISAPSINNILLKNEENKPAVFLFHPKVSSNRHPNGTVEFTSKGYNKGGSDYAWQKFGVPTQTGELSEISIENNVATAFGKFNYEATTPAWEVIGYLNHAPALVLGDLDQAFEYYQMEHNTATVGTKVTFKGKLVGNDCPAPVIRPNFWNGYANSYSAPIDGSALLAQIPAPADKAFYLYEWDVISEKFSWVAKSNLSIKDIQPMQPFLLRNPSADSAALALNYEAAVYNPATTPSNAPARSVANNITKVEFIVRGEAGVDHVIVAQDDEFSAAFDNGYDVTKYMNDDVNMYVTADEKMAIFATDNLENTYVGFQSVKGGNYTITFANVQGEELTLIDHETGARVLMVEGNTYEFTAAANATNDYRFEVVGAAKLPTAIENTEAVKSAKGIYTITGQYLGEMNVWNSLPAGVYVVNGEKRVK